MVTLFLCPKYEKILNHLFEHKTFTREQSKDILKNIALGKYNNSQMAAL
jgi:anthranilate phosphoribosyltransferase